MLIGLAPDSAPESVWEPRTQDRGFLGCAGHTMLSGVVLQGELVIPEVVIPEASGHTTRRYAGNRATGKF